MSRTCRQGVCQVQEREPWWWHTILRRSSLGHRRHIQGVQQDSAEITDTVLRQRRQEPEAVRLVQQTLQLYWLEGNLPSMGQGVWHLQRQESLQGSLSEGCSDASGRRRPAQVPEARERQISWQKWKSKGQTRSLHCV